VTAVGIGQIFLRRLAKDVAEGSPFKTAASRILTDFGVRDVEGFSKYVSGLDKPTVADLNSDGGQHGEDYQTALRRYVNRAVMHPSAATRPLYATHPLGAMLFTLQNYTTTFGKVVLSRAARMAKDAVDPKSGLNAQERMYAMMPVINLIPMAMASYAIGEARDALGPDPADTGKPEMTESAKWIRAGSRMGAFGPYDALVNMGGEYKYQTDVATGLLGPVVGPLATGLGTGFDYVRRAVTPSDDDESTSNALDRKTAASAWDLVLHPIVEGGLAAGVPGGPVSRAVATAATYALADQRTRDKFVDTFGGEKE
jgi:hypothetical protein